MCVYVYVFVLGGGGGGGVVVLASQKSTSQASMPQLKGRIKIRLEKRVIFSLCGVKGLHPQPASKNCAEGFAL